MAQRLAEVVAVFNVGQQAGSLAGVRHAPAPSAASSAAPSMQTKPLAAKPAVQPALGAAAAYKAPAATVPKSQAAPAATPTEAPKLLRSAPVASKAPAVSNDDDWETF